MSEDGLEKERVEEMQRRTGAVSTIPRLTSDLYGQDATQGGWLRISNPSASREKSVSA